MNKIKLIIAIWIFAFVTTLNSSCSKWLDLTPEAQVSSKDLFSTPKGYKDLLNGIYLAATKETLYGDKMLFGFTDAMAQMYQFTSADHNFAELAKYNYSDSKVESQIAAIWKEYYFCIANCNILLENLEGKDASFFSSEREFRLIKGEALALRAFFHFELMRLFQPSFTVADDEAIPYVTKFGHELTSATYKEAFYEKVIADFKAAKDLLNEVDPILEAIFKKPSDPYQAQEDIYLFTQPHPSKDEFISYRGFRINYYAVCALMARAYVYHGDLDSAYPLASEVVKSTCFYFAKSISNPIASRNRIMRSEVIFAFKNNNLTKNFKKYSGLSYDNNNRVTIKNWNTIFTQKADWRLTYLMNTEDLSVLGQVYSIRFVEPLNSTVESSYGNIAPIIRFSEMYYIISEYLMKSGDVTNAKKEYLKLKKARGVYDDITAGTYEEIKSMILNDARREFMCEGQLFFRYKQDNIDVIDESNITFEFNKNYFTLPIPQVELEFGDRLSHLIKK